jgi:NADP-dependent 3-hydroxy acid dehydrogenase YdfG
MPWLNLSNKTALVTGASRSIGRAAALALAAGGAQVIVHYGRNAEQAKAVVDEIRREGGRADEISADLAAPKGPHALAEQLRKRIGERLDILVLNAGISNHTPFEDMTVEEFDGLFAVNVRAQYFLVQQLLPMLGNGSTVIFLASLGARVAVGSLSAYASTKGAINTSSNTLPWRLALAVSASTQWRPESSIPICRVSQRPKMAEQQSRECKPSSASAGPRMSPRSSRSWRRMTPAGSRAIQSPSMADQGSNGFGQSLCRITFNPGARAC